MQPSPFFIRVSNNEIIGYETFYTDTFNDRLRLFRNIRVAPDGTFSYFRVGADTFPVSASTREIRSRSHAEEIILRELIDSAIRIQ